MIRWVVPVLLTACGPEPWTVGIEGVADPGLAGCSVESSEPGLASHEGSELAGVSLDEVVARATALAREVDFEPADDVDLATFRGPLSLDELRPAGRAVARSYDVQTSGGRDCERGPTFTFPAQVVVDAAGRFVATGDEVWVTLYRDGAVGDLEAPAEVTDDALVAALEAIDIDVQRLKLSWYPHGVSLRTDARNGRALVRTELAEVMD